MNPHHKVLAILFGVVLLGGCTSVRVISTGASNGIKGDPPMRWPGRAKVEVHARWLDFDSLEIHEEDRRRLVAYRYDRELRQFDTSIALADVGRIKPLTSVRIRTTTNRSYSFSEGGWWLSFTNGKEQWIHGYQTTNEDRPSPLVTVSSREVLAMEMSESAPVSTISLLIVLFVALVAAGG